MFSLDSPKFLELCQRRFIRHPRQGRATSRRRPRSHLRNKPARSPVRNRRDGAGRRGGALRDRHFMRHPLQHRLSGRKMHLSDAGELQALLRRAAPSHG